MDFPKSIKNQGIGNALIHGRKLVESLPSFEIFSHESVGPNVYRITFITFSDQLSKWEIEQLRKHDWYIAHLSVMDETQLLICLEKAKEDC